jgi:putative flippase GtrA
MDKIKRQFTLKNLIQFIKLQLAGNVLFWGTYLGFFLLHEFANWSETAALATASIFAHVAFFIVDKKWVFHEHESRRKTRVELYRFIIFMTINYFINLAIITALSIYFDITPYVGQFISALFFTFWTFIGLKYWVFKKPHLPAKRKK